MKAQVPPQAQELETAILGALLLESYALEKVIDIIDESHFYSNKNAKIYGAIKHLNNNGEPIDMLTVSERLKQTKDLEFVGGAFYISKLTNNVANASHIENHARIVAQKFIQRELIRVSSIIQSKAFEDVDPLESIALWDEMIILMDKVTGNDSGGRNIADVSRDSIEAYDKRESLSKAGLIAGIPSFSGAITEHTNGWQGENLIIIAGRPGSGKTAYALAEAKAASKNGDNPCFFSLEMSDISLADRLLIAEAEGMGQDELDDGYSYRFRKGCLKEEEKERLYLAHTELKKLNLFVDDKAGCNLNYISKVAKSLNKRGKCDMIIIDYLQLLTGSGKKQNREQEVSEMTRGLKLLAKEISVPVFLLAQLNREVERRPSKQPIMADLRESGSIEQDADIIIFPFRPRYYIEQDPTFEDLIRENTKDKYPDTDWKDTAIMIFAKDRANGTTKILVEVNKSCTTWRDEKNYRIDQSDKRMIDPSEGFDDIPPF
jgi:replicative DNA helicase